MAVTGWEWAGIGIVVVVAIWLLYTWDRVLYRLEHDDWPDDDYNP